MKMLEKIFKIGPKEEDKIEIWSDVPGLTEVMPVQESFHFLPNWFVKTPSWSEEKKGIRTDEFQTIKQCPAVPEFMNMGFTIPLWCDLRIKINDDGTAEWGAPRTSFHFGIHPEDQLTNYLPQYAKPTLVLKTHCPWKIKTPPGILLLQLPMLWHFNPIFTVAAGVIWSEFQHEINQQVMFHEKGEFILQQGTPLAQYIPIRREEFNYDIGDQTPEQRLHQQRSWLKTQIQFRGGYKQHIKKLKKCPHHN